MTGDAAVRRSSPASSHVCVTATLQLHRTVVRCVGTTPSGTNRVPAIVDECAAHGLTLSSRSSTSRQRVTRSARISSALPPRNSPSLRWLPALPELQVRPARQELLLSSPSWQGSITSEEPTNGSRSLGSQPGRSGGCFVFPRHRSRPSRHGSRPGCLQAQIATDVSEHPLQVTSDVGA